MPRKPKPDITLPPSKSARKREHQGLQALAEALIALPLSRFKKLELADRTREELLQAREMSPSGSRNRQVRLIAQLLEQEDTEALMNPVTEIASADRAATALHHRAERLRDLLLEQGETALGEFGAELGAADSERLRQLRADATHPGGGNRARQAHREIYRLILARLQAPRQPGT